MNQAGHMVGAQAQYVTLGLAEEVYGVPVAQVREILDLRPISRIPQAPHQLIGMIDVRGDTIPVVDLRRVLEFEDAADTPTTRIVVMAARDGDQETQIGLRTDSVYEVTALDADTLEPPITVAGGNARGSVVGVGRRNGRFVTVLAIDRLLRELLPVAGAAGAGGATMGTPCVDD